MAIYTKRRKAAAPDRLSAIFGALADPTRRAMLERLRTGVCSVTELAEPFGMAQPTISRHLKVLERAGLVVCGRNTQWRPRALKAAPLGKRVSTSSGSASCGRIGSTGWNSTSKN